MVLSGCYGVLSSYQGVAMQMLKYLERLLVCCYVVARALLCSCQGVLVGKSCYVFLVVANGVLSVVNALLCSCLGGCLAVAMMFWVIARGLLCSR